MYTSGFHLPGWERRFPNKYCRRRHHSLKWKMAHFATLRSHNHQLTAAPPPRYQGYSQQDSDLRDHRLTNLHCNKDKWKIMQRVDAMIS